METPKVIKLRTGELIIATLRDETQEGLVWLDNPISVMTQPVIREDMIGETFLLKPWIGISDEKSFLIRKTEIITVCLLKVSLLEQYRKYISGTPIFDQEDEYSEDIDVELESIRAELLRSKNLLN